MVKQDSYYALVSFPPPRKYKNQAFTKDPDFFDSPKKVTEAILKYVYD